MLGSSWGVSGRTGCTASLGLTRGAMHCSCMSSAALVLARVLSAASATSMASKATYTMHTEHAAL